MTVTEPESPRPAAWPSHEDANEAVGEQLAATEEQPEEAPAEEAAPEAPEAEEAPPVDEDGASFPREYVEKLRQEAAGHRTRAKTYDEAFAEFGEDERNYFLGLAKGLADESQHEATAREFVRIGKEILEAKGVDIGDLTAPDPNRPLTLAQLEAREAQQRTTQQQQAVVAGIKAEMKELGYEEGTVDHYAMLRVAESSEDGDLKKADEAVKAWKQKIIDDFVEGQRGKQDKFLKTPPSGGVTPADTEDPPTDWQAARDRANQIAVF